MERMRKVKTRIKTDRFHGDGREGGSLLYVIFFITLLSVFACGFMAVSRYHIKMALKNRAYMEARLTTHMIHNSFCEAVSKGESDALRLLWNQYEGDLEDEEAEENENEDIPETEGAGADGITKLDADEIQDTNERQDADERQDTDLDLEDREYITEGTGRKQCRCRSSGKCGNHQGRRRSKENGPSDAGSRRQCGHRPRGQCAGTAD
jgi:hypothetical protein